MSGPRKELPPMLPTIPFGPDPSEPPEPLLTLVNHSEMHGCCVTSVTRVHRPEVGYCGLCPRGECHAELGVCLVSVQEYIPAEEAWRLSTHGRPRPGFPAAGAKDLGRSG